MAGAADRALKPSGTKDEVSSSAISAGPASDMPGARSGRQ